ncbi:MAG: PKD domain-containing protein [Bacteroidetes bacterium]|nr:PKD domain-containing protein [Bacteroidota bacterium]
MKNILKSNIIRFTLTKTIYNPKTIVIMKNKKIQWIFRVLLLVGVVSFVTLNSCKKNDDEDSGTANPVASFQFVVSATNFLEVSFTNYSQNATSYSWNFGDGESSTEKDPVHVYANAGSYTVALTASNAAGTNANYSQAITITDPNSALALLAGETSKTWKFYREGSCAGVGPDAENARSWWALENTGGRPCVYYQEFTFARDGSFTFDDMGSFWGEAAVFEGTANYEVCFDAIAANMINKDGADVSAWLSGTHAYVYDPTVGEITLNGTGAWMGLPQLGTNAESIVPEASKKFDVTIEEFVGYDLMTISYAYDGFYWDFTYASYSDPSLEPIVVEEEPPYGEDLPDLTPTEMWNTFETSDSYELLDTAAVYSPTGGGSAANSMDFTMGVADPAGVGVNCGQYDRWGTYQELQFMMEYDIQFDNFTTVSVDVYMPSSNDYSGTLTKDIAIIIGEASQTDGWWTGHIQYDVTASVMDEWVTYTFNLDSPTSGPGGYTPFERTDLDFFAISIGGGGHDAPGTFYIRNFTFN